MLSGRITPPASAPVSLEDAKSFLRITWNDESQNSVISGLVEAAASMVENYCRRALMSQTWRATFPPPKGERVFLPRPPVVQIVSAAGLFGTGAELETEIVEPAAGLVSIKGAAGFELVAVEYVAGYETAEAIPPDLLHAVKSLTYHLFDNPSMAGGSIPDDVKTILEPYKLFEIR